MAADEVVAEQWCFLDIFISSCLQKKGGGGNQQRVMKSISKGVVLVFTLLFITAAVLQHNDPDALLWISFYGVAALACLLFLFDRFQPILGFLLGLVYLVAAFWVWPEKFEGVKIGDGDIENIERGREALGLLIVAGVMFFLALKARKK